MWLAVLALVVLLAFVALGAWRGALRTGLGIASLVLAYAAALLAGPPLGALLEPQLGGNPLLAVPLASTGAFFATYAVLGLVSGVVRRLGNTDNRVRSLGDRLLGGGFGAVRGLLLATLIVYLAMWLDALRVTGNQTFVPEVGDAPVAALTGKLMGRVVVTVLGDSHPGARFAGRVAERPRAAAAELKSVIEDPNFMSLRRDGRFWSAVESGDVDTALDRASFHRMRHDAQLRHKLADLGFVSEADAADPEQFRRAIAEVLRELGPRLRELRESSALRDLLRDPQVVAMIQQGDTFGLLGHPGVQDLFGRVTSPSLPN